MSQSQPERAAAARSTSSSSTATPRLKFAAQSTGIRDAAACRASRWASEIPVVPDTNAAPRWLHSARIGSKASGRLKSTATSKTGTADSSLAVKCGTPSMTRCPTLRCTAATTSTGISGARRSSARPMRPDAPWTRTRTGPAGSVMDQPGKTRPTGSIAGARRPRHPRGRRGPGSLSQALHQFPVGEQGVHGVRHRLADIVVVRLGALDDLHAFGELTPVQQFVWPRPTPDADALHRAIHLERSSPEPDDHVVVQVSDLDPKLAGFAGIARGTEAQALQPLFDRAAHDRGKVAIDRHVGPDSLRAPRPERGLRALVHHVHPQARTVSDLATRNLDLGRDLHRLLGERTAAREPDHHDDGQPFDCPHFPVPL